METEKVVELPCIDSCGVQRTKYSPLWLKEAIGELSAKFSANNVSFIACIYKDILRLPLLLLMNPVLL